MSLIHPRLEILGTICCSRPLGIDDHAVKICRWIVAEETELSAADAVPLSLSKVCWQFPLAATLVPLSEIEFTVKLGAKDNQLSAARL